MLAGLAFFGAIEHGFARADCLSIPQARMLLRTGKIIPLVAALRTARATPHGEMIDGRLCGGPNGKLAYVVTFLGEDGRVTRVSVDAQSGAILRIK